MPQYSFSNPNKPEEIVHIFLGMNDKHEYIQNGVVWDRIWYNPKANIDTKWDEESVNDFVEKTGKKRGTIGDIHDKNTELSEKRAQRYGKDPIREKYYDNYSKKTKGKKQYHKILEENKNRVVEI